MYTTELRIKGQDIPIRHMKDDLFYTPIPLEGVFPIFKAVSCDLFMALDVEGSFQTDGGSIACLDTNIKKFHELEQTATKIFIMEYSDVVKNEFKSDHVEMFELFLKLKPTGDSSVLKIETPDLMDALCSAVEFNSVIVFPTGLCLKPTRYEKIDTHKFVCYLDIVYQTPAGNVHPEFYIEKSACRTYSQFLRKAFGFNSNLNNQRCETYVVADTHFFHKGILDFGKARKDFNDLDEMHKAFIELWNDIVKPCDNIIVVGDFSFKGIEATAELICRLNGRIIFIEGNHDRKMLQNLGMTHYQYLELKRGSLKICISHFPIMCWNGQAHGAVHLHGHTHGHLRPIGKMFDVGIDNTNNILNINDAIAVADSRGLFCPDGRDL